MTISNPSPSFHMLDPTFWTFDIWSPSASSTTPTTTTPPTTVTVTTRVRLTLKSQLL